MMPMRAAGGSKADFWSHEEVDVEVSPVGRAFVKKAKRETTQHHHHHHAHHDDTRHHDAHHDEDTESNDSGSEWSAGSPVPMANECVPTLQLNSCSTTPHGDDVKVDHRIVAVVRRRAASSDGGDDDDNGGDARGACETTPTEKATLSPTSSRSLSRASLPDATSLGLALGDVATESVAVWFGGSPAESNLALLRARGLSSAVLSLDKLNDDNSTTAAFGEVSARENDAWCCRSNDSSPLVLAGEPDNDTADSMPVLWGDDDLASDGDGDVFL
jgi:hypothetical protein